MNDTFRFMFGILKKRYVTFEVLNYRTFLFDVYRIISNSVYLYVLPFDISIQILSIRRIREMVTVTATRIWLLSIFLKHTRQGFAYRHTSDGQALYAVKGRLVKESILSTRHFLSNAQVLAGSPIDVYIPLLSYSLVSVITIYLSDESQSSTITDEKSSLGHPRSRIAILRDVKLQFVLSNNHCLFFCLYHARVSESLIEYGRANARDCILRCGTLYHTQTATMP